MIIKKITVGFVVQTYDTDAKLFGGQEFIAGDEVDYENFDGSPANWEQMKKRNFGPLAEQEPYLPFDMVQPNPRANIP